MKIIPGNTHNPNVLPPKVMQATAAGPEQPAINPETAIEALVREALPLSFFVYDPLRHMKKELGRAGFERIKALNFLCSGTQGICCVRGERAYVMFRGSASFLDWIVDFLLLPFFWPMCHFGFGLAWRTVRGSVRDWLKQLPQGVTGVMLGGHSLGGGIAHVAALELAEDFKIDAVVTFGAPKACFLGTATRYDNTKIHGSDKALGVVTHAVVNQRDMVAKVPFSLLGFRDVGQLIYIEQGGDVHFGKTAHQARAADSNIDFEFLFHFMEEEKTAAFGLSSASRASRGKIRRGFAWVGENFPLLKTILTPILLYVLFSMYFMRSGLAHLGAKYLNVFMTPFPAWRYTRYEKTAFEKILALTVRLVMGGVLLALFLWGLFTIASWTVAGLTHPR